MKSAATLTFVLLTCVLSAVDSAAAASAKPSTELTVYTDGYALVKDQRQLPVELHKGLNEVRFRDVAGTIEADSVHFASLTDPKARVIEQNYEFDLVNADKLLQKYVDQQVSLVTADGQLFEGTLLAFDPGQLIVQTQGGLVLLARDENLQSIRLASLPEGLLTRPTLLWQLQTDVPGRHVVQISYIAKRIKWRVDYNLVTNADDTAADLFAWVTLTNNSGASYRDARVKLIAGYTRPDRYRPFTYGANYYKTVLSELKPTAGRGADPSVAFGDLRLYKLDGRCTLADRQIKQIQLLAAKAIPFKKIYIYDGAKIQWSPWTHYGERRFGREQNKKVNVLLQLENRADRNLGIALPAGKVRVFKRDRDGALEFIGEDRIGHTAPDERVMVYIGDAFDLVGERKQTDFRKVTKSVVEESFEITLRNHKKSPVTIRVLEKMYRSRDWKILAASHEYRKLNARTIHFDVQVPPDAERKVTYKVRYSW